MKLMEYMGKELFKRYGIPIPAGGIAKSPQEAAAWVAQLGPSVLKAQVLSGKRGKSGGIRFVSSAAEAEQTAAAMLSHQLQGMAVTELLVEQQLDIRQELYLALTIDTATRCPLLIASVAGGMDIEEVPEEQLVRLPLDNELGWHSFIGRQVCQRLQIAGQTATQLQDLLQRLYHMFIELDAELVEINPLAVTPQGLIAADAKVTIDDEALYRQQSVPRTEERTSAEQKAHALGLSYIQLDGDIAVMANGAGITMATLDIIQNYGGKPANFLDAGGGAGVEATAGALEILLSTNPRAILINIFGGITRCDDVARAFIQVKQSREIPVPVVIRLVGTNQDQGVQLLQANGLVAYESMQEAAARVVELAYQAG